MSFCSSNADYIGPKTNINFHLEVDDNFFSTHLTTLPTYLKSQKNSVFVAFINYVSIAENIMILSLMFIVYNNDYIAVKTIIYFFCLYTWINIQFSSCYMHLFV